MQLEIELYVRRDGRVECEAAASLDDRVLDVEPYFIYVFLHVGSEPAVGDCVVISRDNIALLVIDEGIEGRRLNEPDYVKVRLNGPKFLDNHP